MLYIYHGNDINAARGKLRATIDHLLNKNPEALLIRITAENAGDYDFAELTAAQALFKNEYIVLLDDVLAEDATKEEILKFTKEIKESQNLFFLLEEKIDAKTLKKLEKHAHKVQHFPLATDHLPLITKFNTFALTDALGAGDTKKLWTLFWEAKHAGVTDEEIHGVLFWGVKSMYMADHSNTATQCGLKPFVFNKSKGYAQKHGAKHTQQMLNTLITLPHESRRQGTPLTITLEHFILSRV